MSKSLYWTDIVFPGELADLSPVGTEGVVVPRGTTDQRPEFPINGTIRFNVETENTEIFQGGSWFNIATTGVTGFNNAENLGAGQPILASASLPNLRFRTLVAGTNVNLVSNSNTITINAPSIGEANTGNNVGGGVGLFDSKVGSTLNFQTLTTTTPGAISISPSGGGEVEIDFVGTLGEANSGTNIGAGVSVFESKIGTTLRFRSIRSTGAPIGVAQNGNNVDISFDEDAVFPGSGAVTVPIGTNAQRPNSPVVGMFRYNTTNNEFEGYIAGSWTTFETSSGIFVQLSGDTMTGDLIMNGSDVNINAGGILNINGGDIIMNGPGSDLIMTTGGDILMGPGSTVDGRDVSADGLVLDSINASNGIIARTGPNAFAGRVLNGIANQIVITNETGVSGDPSIGIATDAVFPGTGAVTIPVGTNGQRPGTPTSGMVRLNNSDTVLEYYAGSDWVQVVDSSGGVISGNLDLSGNNLTNAGLVNGRDMIADGVILDDLDAIDDDTGFVVKSGGSLITRLISASVSDEFLGINVVGGDGSAASEIGLDITGCPNITTLDTADELVVYDVNLSQNRKATVQDIADIVSTSGLESRFLSQYGDQTEGRMTILEDLIMPDSNVIVYSDPNATISATGTFSINGIGPISVNAGDDVFDVATAINTDVNIIADGTITAEVVGTVSTLRIIRSDPSPMVLADITNTPLADLGFVTGSYSNIATVDGRDVSADGAVLDEINVATEFGLIARVADGPPGNFERRTLTASTTLGQEGVIVTNGDGVAANPTIGVDITGRAGTTGGVTGSDEFLIYDASTGGNDKASMVELLSYVRDNVNRSNFRVSQSSFAIVNGTSVLPFTSSAGDFDENGDFNDATDTFLPPIGTYRLGVYIEVDSGSASGRYEFRIRRNGVAEGNFGVVVSDASNLNVGYLEDLFQANGSDSFTVEINNSTGGASTIKTARFYGYRVF